jgi:hypothetical protein
MIIRPFQGGFTHRKLVYWGRSFNRFRFQAIVVACLFAYPFKVELVSFIGHYMNLLAIFYVSIFRNPAANMPNQPLLYMNPANQIAFLPPNPKYFKKTFDVDDIHKLYVDNQKVERFKTLNEVDVVRTRCLYAHPSRETNGVVEGELLRNEQDKIVDSMKVMMAEFGVSKGIWKNVADAFRKGDEIERRRVREIMKGLDKLL